METRANHLLIGGFVLAAVAAFFVFMIWLAKVQVDSEFARYDIFFTGSVSGLALGSDVRYRGIRIGKVEDIRIDPNDPAQVQVRIEIDQANRMRQGDVASLQTQGLTGVAFVNISGADRTSPPLEPPEDAEVAVIPSQASEIEQLFTDAPELVNQGVVLLERVGGLLSTQNLNHVSGILADLRQTTSALASQSETLPELIQRMDTISLELSGLLQDSQAAVKVLRGTLIETDALVIQDLSRLIGDMRQATQSIDGVARDLSELVQTGTPPLEAFAADNLPEFGRFVTEARLLIERMSRVVQRVESDGARFLLGRPDAEFEAN